MSITLKNWQKFALELEQCCLKHSQADIVRRAILIEAYVASEPDGESGYSLFKLDDEKWATMIEWQDYTGHG